MPEKKFKCDLFSLASDSTNTKTPLRYETTRSLTSFYPSRRSANAYRSPSPNASSKGLSADDAPLEAGRSTPAKTQGSIYWPQKIGRKLRRDFRGAVDSPLARPPVQPYSVCKNRQFARLQTCFRLRKRWGIGGMPGGTWRRIPG